MLQRNLVCILMTHLVMPPLVRVFQSFCYERRSDLVDTFSQRSGRIVQCVCNINGHAKLRVVLRTVWEFLRSALSIETWVEPIVEKLKSKALHIEREQRTEMGLLQFPSSVLEEAPLTVSIFLSADSIQSCSDSGRHDSHESLLYYFFLYKMQYL